MISLASLRLSWSSTLEKKQGERARNAFKHYHFDNGDITCLRKYSHGVIKITSSFALLNFLKHF